MANNAVVVRLTARADTAANFAASNLVLLAAEFAYETDTKKLKFGDGVTAYSSLPYFTGSIESALANCMKISDYKGSTDGVVKAADKLATARTINGVSFDGTGNITISDSDKIPTSQKGVANGVATLDSSGQVPSSQLPSYVDDIIEGYYYSGKFYKESTHVTVITGEGGKIYIDISSTADAKACEYRWSGSAYVSVSNPLDIASQTEATAGTDNTKAMTPLRTEQAITAKGYITSGTAADTYEPKIATKNSAFNASLATVMPATETAGDAGAIGTSTAVARADHKHPMPASMPPSGSAGGDLTGSYPNPTIGAGKVSTTKIADGSVTVAKIADGTITDAKMAAASLSTSKLFVPSGDVLILDGGSAST